MQDGRKQVQNVATGGSQYREVAANHRGDWLSTTAMTDNAEVRGPSTQIQEREQPGFAIGPDGVRIASRHQDEITFAHRDFSASWN